MPSATSLLCAALLLRCLVVVSALWPTPNDGHYFYRNISQPVDHFNSGDSRRFLQQFQLYDGYFQPGGPVIYLLGPERGLTTYEITYSSMGYYAAAMNALIVASEHRYYGQSLPFGPVDSFVLPNMVYLTIQQSLADYVALVQAVKATVPGASHSPVFTFGGSYAGFLSAVIRQTYPSVVAGAIASAAPVYTYSAAEDTWFDEVTLSYQNANQTCATSIARSFAQLEADLSNQTLYSAVQRNLNLCENITTANWQLVFQQLKQCFSTVTQFNYPLRNLLCEGWPLQTLCGKYDASSSEKSYASLRIALDMCYNISQTPLSCFDFTGAQGPLPAVCTQASHVPSFSRFDATHVPASAPINPWTYQSCTQYIMPVAGAGMFQVDSWSAGWSLPQAQAVCQYVIPGAPWMPYPPVLTAPACADNAAVGCALEETAAANFSRVVFSNHAYDPVRGYSPQQNITSSGDLHRVLDPLLELYAINVADSAHCLDLICLTPTAPFSSDPPAVIQARQFELEMLNRWLRV
jgi:lysosomal Pro-X carboxypeptidase